MEQFTKSLISSFQKCQIMKHNEILRNNLTLNKTKEMWQLKLRIYLGVNYSLGRENVGIKNISRPIQDKYGL